MVQLQHFSKDQVLRESKSEQYLSLYPLSLSCEAGRVCIRGIKQVNLDCSAQLDERILQVYLSSSLRSGRIEKPIDIFN